LLVSKAKSTHGGGVQISDTASAVSIEALQGKFNIHPDLSLKSLIYVADEQDPVMVLIRGDLDVEPVKLANALQANDVRLATGEEIDRLTGGSAKGFIGPVGLPDGHEIKIVADATVQPMKDFAMAVNQIDKHMVNCNWGAEIQLTFPLVDVRRARVGDGCPECENGKLHMTRGIEVGNIFQLGTKYSARMNATYTAEDGSEQPFIMGCYGIGISRVVAAAIEQGHDERGIIWPNELAPFQVAICPMNMYKSDRLVDTVEQVYQELTAAGIEVLLDDRKVRAGFMFSDMELIGIPHRIVIGDRGLDSGTVEYQGRTGRESQEVPFSELVGFIKAKLA